MTGCAPTNDRKMMLHHISAMAEEELVEIALHEWPNGEDHSPSRDEKGGIQCVSSSACRHHTASPERQGRGRGRFCLPLPHEKRIVHCNEMKTSDWIALAALILSAVAIAGQAVSAWRNRKRVVIALFTTVAAAAPDWWNEVHLVLKATSVGGSNGIKAINFEWADEAPSDWDVARSEGLAYPPLDRSNLLDVLGAERVIQQGETTSWSFRICAPSNAPGLDTDRRIRARLTLDSGRTVTSSYAPIGPDLRVHVDESGKIVSERRALDKGSTDTAQP